MKKITGLLAALCFALTSVVGFTAATQGASAAGCGLENHLWSRVTVSDNLKVAGRPVSFTLHVSKRDCDGYDLVTGMWGTIAKDGGACTAAPPGGGVWVNDEYRLNPNIISGFNPGTATLDCDNGQLNYRKDWTGVEGQKVYSWQSADNRCVAMHIVVDVVLSADPTYDTDPICFNGL